MPIFLNTLRASYLNAFNPPQHRTLPFHRAGLQGHFFRLLPWHAHTHPCVICRSQRATNMHALKLYAVPLESYIINRRKTTESHNRRHLHTRSSILPLTILSHYTPIIIHFLTPASSRCQSQYGNVSSTWIDKYFIVSSRAPQDRNLILSDGPMGKSGGDCRTAWADLAGCIA